jgi:WD40 repeat protein
MLLLLALALPVRAQENLPITASNVNQLVEVGQMEVGRMAGALAWTPDGETLAVGAWTGLLRYDTPTAAPPPDLTKTLYAPIDLVDFEAGLLAARVEGGLALMDCETGEVITTLTAPFAGFIFQAAVSADGALAAAGSLDGKIRLWDVATGERRFILEAGPTNGFWGILDATLAFNPEGTLLASVTSGMVQLWETASGGLIAEIDIPDGAASAAFSLDGSRLAVGSTHQALIFDVTDPSSPVQQTTLAGQERIVQVRFSPDGTQLAAMEANVGVRLWSLTDGVERHMFDSYGPAQNIAFNPDGTRLAVLSEARGALIYDTAGGETLAVLSNPGAQISEITFSPDGRLLAVSYLWSWGMNVGLELWDMTVSSPVQVTEIAEVGVQGLVFSPDSERLAGLGFIVDGETSGAGVLQWDVESGERLSFFAHPLAGSREDGLSGLMHGAAYSADGSRIVSGRGDGAVFVWDAATGNLLATLGGHSGPVTDAAFSLGGLLATTAGYEDNTVRLWNLDNPTEPIRTMQDPTDNQVYHLAFSPDGRIVASSAGGGETVVSLWDVATGEQLKRLSQDGGDGSIAFSPDGGLIAVSSMPSDGAYGRGLVQLWSVATGELLHTVELNAPVNSVAFSPDGKVLALGSADGTVRLMACR